MPETEEFGEGGVGNQTRTTEPHPPGLKVIGKSASGADQARTVDVVVAASPESGSELEAGPDSSPPNKFDKQEEKRKDVSGPRYVSRDAFHGRKKSSGK